jgi:hypothetical protein
LRGVFGIEFDQDRVALQAISDEADSSSATEGIEHCPAISNASEHAELSEARGKRSEVRFAERGNCDIPLRAPVSLEAFWCVGVSCCGARSRLIVHVRTAAEASSQFRRVVESYRELTSPRAPYALLSRLSEHFDRPGALPAELILDGWVLDHAPGRYCPIRDNRGQCSPYGADARNAHSALIVGRRLVGGVCQALVRNSWKGACLNGRYGLTGRECLANVESVWIPEIELAAGLSGIRAVW